MFSSLLCFSPLFTIKNAKCVKKIVMLTLIRYYEFVIVVAQPDYRLVIGY